METIKNNFDAVMDYLNSLNNGELVNIHNLYCDNCNCSDDYIYNNDESFFEDYFSNDVLGAVRAVCFGEYQYNDMFVQYNGYGNLETFNSPDDYIDLTEICNDILENPEVYDIELEEEEGN